MAAYKALKAAVAAARAALQRLRKPARAAAPAPACKAPPAKAPPPEARDGCGAAAPGSPGCLSQPGPTQSHCALQLAADPAVDAGQPPASPPCLPPRLPLSRRSSMASRRDSLGCPSVVATPRAVPASPFAAQRSRLSSDSARSSVDTGPRGSPGSPAALADSRLVATALCSAFYQPAQRQPSAASNRTSLDSLGSPLEELLQHRALEDADLLEPFGPGVAVAAPPPPPPLTAAALPAELRPWLVPAEDVELLHRPGKEGEDWVLGEGAR